MTTLASRLLRVALLVDLLARGHRGSTVRQHRAPLEHAAELAAGHDFLAGTILTKQQNRQFRRSHPRHGIA